MADETNKNRLKYQTTVILQNFAESILDSKATFMFL